jgi:hypothetical protein
MSREVGIVVGVGISSFFPLTSSIIKLFLLPSTILHRRILPSSLLHQPSDIKQRECGRVAWTIDKFIVLVGKWAEPIQEQLTELLEQEFSLPNFEFVYAECPPIELGGTASA